MNNEMGLTEFFAMEAGEYLERLDSLVSGAVGPDRDELVRLARALRGSALMANQQAIGSVAAALESLARAIKEERADWNEANRQTVTGAVDGLKILVRGASTWGDAEDARATRLAAELAAAAGVAPPELGAERKPAVDTGTRAFVAREGATVASVLNQTARTMQRDGPSKGQLETVLRSMEPLRGLAALSELTPLPEYLDGVELVAGRAARGLERPNDLALFLDVAAQGLSKAAQEISTAGTAEADAPESREFTRRLSELLNIGESVVPIQSLYYEDDGPHVLEAGSRSEVSGQMQQAELVAHGEHLCQVADGLDRAQWDMQREIRAIALKSTLRTLTAARGDTLSTAVSGFADVALDALANGYLEQHKDGFVLGLRDAGMALGSAAQKTEESLVFDLNRASENLKHLPHGVEAAPAAPSSPSGALSRPPAPSAAVPSPTRRVEPAEPDTAFASIERPVIADSWSAYESLRERLGDGEPSMDDLVAGVREAAAVEEPGEPEPAMPSEVVEAEEISIVDLCYQGEAALAEARNVQNRIRSELASPSWNAADINELIDELLDLVELGVGQN